MSLFFDGELDALWLFNGDLWVKLLQRVDGNRVLSFGPWVVNLNNFSLHINIKHNRIHVGLAVSLKNTLTN